MSRVRFVERLVRKCSPALVGTVDSRGSAEDIKFLPGALLGRRAGSWTPRQFFPDSRRDRIIAESEKLLRPPGARPPLSRRVA